MPLPLAVPVGLLVGMLLAWLARAELARSDVPLVLSRPFLASIGVGVLVHAPVLAYFAARHGDWAYLYLVRSSRVPSAVDLAGILFCAAQVPLGFALVAGLAAAKRGERVLGACLAASAVLVAALVLCAQRLGVSATFTQFHGGFGVVPVRRSPLGRGLLLSWAALAASYAWTLWALRRPRGER